MALSAEQRALIRQSLSIVASESNVTFLEEGQKIKNLDDFPLVQCTFMSEGRRQRFWQDLLHEAQDPVSKYWQTYYGNISQATVSVSIESLSLEELQALVPVIALALWSRVTNWRMEVNNIEFRGTDPPKYMPAFLHVDQRHDIYKCVIDFFVDYEFSWPRITPPITNFYLNATAGNEPEPEIDLISIAPGRYQMTATIRGESSAYRMKTTITGNVSAYRMTSTISE